MLKSKKGNDIFYIRQKFDDFEQFNEEVKSWSLDFKQLDAGKFKGELMIMEMEHLQLLSAKFNRKFDQEVVTPKGYRTFVIPADQKQSFKWRGYDIDSNKLLIVPKSGEMDAISSPGFNVYTISISEHMIEAYRQSLGFHKLNLIDSGLEVVDFNSQSMNILRQQLQYLISQVNDHAEIIHKKAFQKIFTDEVPSILLKNLVNFKSIKPIPSKRIRDISLSKAIDYINSCGSELPTVMELCLIAGASQRTLEYAFKEKYGIGPKDYMKKLQLNKVFKMLKSADPNKTKILNIAYKNGFSHMGQFGHDYKNFFGELPSITLNK